MMDNWKEALVAPDLSIEEGIKAIDLASERIAMVVDKNNKLIGIVTDGDVRRAILNHIPLENPISEIMNHRPVISRQGARKEEILLLLREHRILVVPVVNEAGVVVGAETLEGLTGEAPKENPVFLMAGGLGMRLRPLTEDCPKPMLKVGGKPVLETIIGQFIESGFSNFFISTGYLAETIEDYFGDGTSRRVSIRYVREDEPLGTGGALGLLPDDLPDLPMIVMNGDILTKTDFVGLLRFHEETQALATVAVRKYEYQVPYGVIHSKDAAVVRIDEKPLHKFFVNAGIYILDSSIRSMVRNGEHIDMTLLLNRLVEEDAKVSLYPIHEHWLDIGEKTDFDLANQDFAKDYQ